MIKEKGFDVIISSDAQYNELCAEIYYDRKFVAIITQEGGIERASIEIESNEQEKIWSFQFSEFFEVLKSGFDALKNMHREHEQG